MSDAPKRPQMHPNTPTCTAMPPNGAHPVPSDQFRASKCTQMPPSAPECTLNSRNSKTNPPRPLTLRQHAAMRYLVRGYPVGKIAAHLGISRHTIKRWKRDAQFVAAMEQLRSEMTAAIISPAAKASPPPRPMDPLASYCQTRARPHAGAERSAAPAASVVNHDDLHENDGDDDDDDDDLINDVDDYSDIMSDEDAAETEAWIEQVIAAGRTGGKIPPPPPPRGSL